MTEVGTATAEPLGDKDKPAVGALAGSLSSAWAQNSAEAFAAIFTQDATVVLPGDVFLQGKDAIRDYMAAGYAGPYKGTGVTGRPLSIRFIDAGTAVMVTEGGVTLPGADTVTPAQLIRATWVCVLADGQWKVSSYQNSPVNIPLA